MFIVKNHFIDSRQLLPWIQICVIFPQEDYYLVLFAYSEVCKSTHQPGVICLQWSLCKSTHQPGEAYINLSTQGKHVTAFTTFSLDL